MCTTLYKTRTVVIGWHCYNIIACFNQITNIKDMFDEADRSWNLRSFGILRSVEWYFLTDVSGQPIGPIFKSQIVQSLFKQSKAWTAYSWRWDGYVLPKLRYESTFRRCIKSQKNAGHLHCGGSLKSRRSWGYRASKFYLIFCKFKALRVFNDTLIPNSRRIRRLAISSWETLFYCSPNHRVY